MIDSTQKYIDSNTYGLRFFLFTVVVVLVTSQRFHGTHHELGLHETAVTCHGFRVPVKHQVVCTIAVLNSGLMYWLCKFQVDTSQLDTPLFMINTLENVKILFTLLDL